MRWSPAACQQTTLLCTAPAVDMDSASTRDSKTRSTSRSRGCARQRTRGARAPRQVLATTSEDGACVLWAWELGVPAERLELPPGARHGRPPGSSQASHAPCAVFWRQYHMTPACLPSCLHAATVQYTVQSFAEALSWRRRCALGCCFL